MAMAATYTQGFEDTLNTLGAPEAMAEPLRRAFTDIAAEWRGANPTEASRFSSGVCPDGSPVEISLRVRNDGQQYLRFIAQPCEPGVPEERRAAWEADRARTFMSRWGGPKSRARLDAALSIYPDGADPTFTGNFRVWLGLAADTHGNHATKVYFNPWACRPDYRGAYALHHLLSTAGVPGATLDSLLPWLRPGLGATPHIVGWNVKDDRVVSVKLYLQAVVDTRRLAEVAPDAWAPWTRVGVRLRPEGEVHLALVHDGSGASPVRLNLLCPDWFRSDVEVVEALRGQSPAAADALGRLVAGSRRSTRNINFVALEPDAVTAYVKVA